MKLYLLTVTIFYVLTQICTNAFEKSDENNVVANHHSRQLSSDSLEENQRRFKLPYEDKVSSRDRYYKNDNLVRFEDDPPRLTNELHFFPSDALNQRQKETHNDGEIFKKIVLHSDEQFHDNDNGIRFDEDEKYGNRDSKYSGTVTFEANTIPENGEPVVKKRRKSKRKQRVYPLLGNNAISPISHFNYPGNSYQNQQSGSLLDRPGYDNSFQGYGLYPGYQIPAHQLQNPVHSGQNSQTNQLNTKYGIQYPAGPVGGQASPLISGYLHNLGYPGNGKYGFHPYPNAQYGLHPGYPGYPGLPQRRPKSLTQQAVSAVAEALTSIALFDDKQCVPRILCEVASGSSAASPNLLKLPAGFGPLLSILQSYNSLSTSPLFHFGRAAALGMTSIGNPTACLRAYPECPRDPTELVNYLNNHNGGFFRFFGQPGPQKPQNLEQFYSHLAGQTGQQQTLQPNYAYSYGYGNQKPYVNSNNSNNYRQKDNGKNTKETDQIQDRIQNKPSVNFDDVDNTEDSSNWTFPDKNNDRRRRPRKQKLTADITGEEDFSQRGGALFKFPNERGSTDYIETDKRKDYIRTPKVNFFPNQQDLNFETNSAASKINLQEYEFDYKHNFYVKRPEQGTNFVNDEAQIVYIVRGNGDPNHPEIVKVNPGQRA